jgi:hypothetical protein
MTSPDPIERSRKRRADRRARREAQFEAEADRVLRNNPANIHVVFTPDARRLTRWLGEVWSVRAVLVVTGAVALLALAGVALSL